MVVGRNTYSLYGFSIRGGRAAPQSLSQYNLGGTHQITAAIELYLICSGSKTATVVEDADIEILVLIINLTRSRVAQLATLKLERRSLLGREDVTVRRCDTHINGTVAWRSQLVCIERKVYAQSCCSLHTRNGVALLVECHEHNITSAHNSTLLHLVREQLKYVEYRIL